MQAPRFGPNASAMLDSEEELAACSDSDEEGPGMRSTGAWVAMLFRRASWYHSIVSQNPSLIVKATIRGLVEFFRREEQFRVRSPKISRCILQPYIRSSRDSIFWESDVHVEGRSWRDRPWDQASALEACGTNILEPGRGETNAGLTSDAAGTNLKD